MASVAQFAAFDTRDRNFFLGFVVVSWLGVILGFAPPSWARFNGHADYPAPLVLQVHAGLFTLWMILLTAQVALIRAKLQSIHRKLGAIGAALIPLMVLTGFFAEAYSQRFYLGHPPDSQAFFIIPIFYVAAFGMVATMAVLRRKDSAAHKRLIYIATTVIVGAAWTRTIGRPLTGLVGDGYWGMIGNTFTSTNLLLGALVLFDWRTRGRLHPVVLTVVPAIIACELAVSWIYHAPQWLPVARAIVTPLPGPPF
jgi:uncharacterized membrane protein YozB (DUF420 family)